MIGSDAFTTPMRVALVDNEVLLMSPDGRMSVCLTLDAALHTAEQIWRVSDQARARHPPPPQASENCPEKA